MQTHSYVPPAPLSFFVEVIWFSAGSRFDYANLTLPMLHHELVINFSDHFEVSSNNNLLINNQTAWLSGLHTQLVRTDTNGKHFTLGALFKPWGLYALTGIDAIELQNKLIPLEIIFAGEARQLTGQIFQQAIPARMFSLLEQFLLKKLNGRIVPAYLLHSLKVMQQAQSSDGRMNTIAGKIGVSSKTFIQTFKKHIGITPGKFHHLLLLNELLHKLAQRPAQKLTEIGYDLHFFDQAHFIRFFKNYTGFTPSAYIHLFKAGKINPAIPHSIEMALQEV